MENKKLKWYFMPITINILIVAGIITFGVTTIVAMVLVYLRSAAIDKELIHVKTRKAEMEKKFEHDTKKLHAEHDFELDKLVKKQKQYNQTHGEIEIELMAKYDKKEKSLENEFDKRVNDLHSFTQNYLEENYIERRDSVLLEQLSYTPIEERYELSSEYKARMKELEENEKSLIKTNDFVLGSIAEKKSEESKIEKVIVAGFNAITDNEISQVSIKNFESKKKKINKTVEQFNDGLSLIYRRLKLNPQVIKIKQEKLSLMLEYKEKVEEEKELLREAREREKEEKKLNALLDKEIEKIEKEKKKLAVQKEVYFERMAEEQNEDMKKAILVEIEKLNTAENELNDSEKTLEEKKKLTGAGYVYIISNIGSFGEEVYKIGMTRRQEPLDRVKELGDASVPFLFDVHALIYSKNAYELENQLHNEFANKRVNKINKRKEFFNVTLNEIKTVVLEKYNGTVDFIETPEAIEYRETILIEEAM